MIKNKNRQILVLDTSVLVHDPNAINTFSNSEIYLPITILEELDKVKKLPNDAGRNARIAIKQLDLLADQGSIHQGIKIINNNILKIDVNDYGHLGSDANYGDNRILACARKLQSSNKSQTVALVSRDINLRIRAKAFGLTALDYNKNRSNELDFYTGIKKINNEEMGARLISDGELILDEFKELQDLFPNECVMFLTVDNKFIAAGRKYKDHIKLIREKNPWGLIPKNPEQQLAIDLMMDPKIPLISLVGSAGGGKTLITLACGLELVLNQKRYNTLSIYRPMQSFGPGTGFLPGGLEEKLNPWFAAVDDSFSVLFSGNSKKKNSWKETLYQYMDDGTIQKECLSYIRGRSMPNSLIIIDESQNCSKEEIKTIITRVGQNSKIILTGDIQQIDNSHLDATNNGLTYLIEKFKEYDVAAHITLTKGERSSLASIAADIL